MFPYSLRRQNHQQMGSFVELTNNQSSDTSTQLKKSQTVKSQKLEHFKIEIDSSKCQEHGDDTALRQFRKKVMEKFGFSENFKIYNNQGLLIEESEIYFLQNDANNQAVVYISAANESFDYETYIKMFKNLKKLGEGGYGLVHLGRHVISGEEFAIKFMMPSQHRADEAGKAFKEAQVLQSMKHANIIKLHNVFQLSDTKIVLLMEYIQGGNLKDYILTRERYRITEEEASQLMIQIGSAINYCHQQQIVHRDIKLENIMLNQPNDLNQGIKIIDFGIAGKIEKSLEQHKAGTLRYCPPELLSEQSFKADPSFDVWSLGILLYRLVFGKFPFDGEDWTTTKQAIIKSQFSFPEDSDWYVSDTCKALIKLMLNKIPHKRPKLYQLIRHPWFQSHQNPSMMNTSMFPQDTMMNFFKQELNLISQKTLKLDESSSSPISLSAKKRIKQQIKSDKVTSRFHMKNKANNRANTLLKYQSPYSISSINNERVQYNIVNNEGEAKFQLKDNIIRKSHDLERKNLSNLRQYRVNNLQNYLHQDHIITPKQIEMPSLIVESQLAGSYSTKNRVPKSKILSVQLKNKQQSNQETQFLPAIKQAQVTIDNRRSEPKQTDINLVDSRQLTKSRILTINDRERYNSDSKLNQVPSVQSFRSIQVNNKISQLTPVNKNGQLTTKGKQKTLGSVSQFNLEQTGSVIGSKFELPQINDTLHEEDFEETRVIGKINFNNPSQGSQKANTKRQQSLNTGLASTSTTVIDDKSVGQNLNHKNINYSKKTFKLNSQNIIMVSSNHSSLINKLSSKLNLTKDADQYENIQLPLSILPHADFLNRNGSNSQIKGFSSKNSYIREKSNVQSEQKLTKI
eukprot:403335795